MSRVKARRKAIATRRSSTSLLQLLPTRRPPCDRAPQRIGRILFFGKYGLGGNAALAENDWHALRILRYSNFSPILPIACTALINRSLSVLMNFAKSEASK